jgi:hypothetical protein
MASISTTYFFTLFFTRSSDLIWRAADRALLIVHRGRRLLNLYRFTPTNQSGGHIRSFKHPPPEDHAGRHPYDHHHTPPLAHGLGIHAGKGPRGAIIRVNQEPSSLSSEEPKPGTGAPDARNFSGLARSSSQILYKSYTG